MSFRKITTDKLSNAQKKTLRDYYYTETGKQPPINKKTGEVETSISKIARQMGLANGDEAYEELRAIYNEWIDEKQKEKKKQTRTAYNVKQLTNVIANIQKEYNNAIVNTPFVNTTMSSQISTKFAISEYSMQTRYDDIIKHALDTTAKKYKIKSSIVDNDLVIYKYNGKPFHFVTDPDVDKLIKRIYDLLMVHSGQYNRIFITNRESGVVVSSKLKGNFTYEDFAEVIKKIIQSAGIAVLGNLTFTIQQRNIPEGGTCVDVPQFLKGKKGISVIINDDDLCGQRCLVLADCKTNDDLRQMKTEKSKSRFEKKVVDLCNELELKGRMSFTDFEKFADSRQKQIIIVSGLFVVMYETATEYEEQVYIYYDTAINHYHFIHDINSASNDSKCNNKWCKSCKKSIRRSNFEGHKCKETICGLCSTKFSTIIEKEKHFTDAKKNKSWVKCDTCFVWCPDDCCLEKHSEKCKGDVKKCQECKKWIKADHYEKHTCGEKFCRNCESYYCGEHRCYITPLKDYMFDDEGNKVFPTWIQSIYAYDFESMFDENNNHIVNLCICKELFGEKAYTFYNIEEFVKFAVSCKNTTFIAHNGKAYDNWLVHKYIIKHTAHRPTKLILAGNKIMYMKVKSVRFIDSLNHIAQGLATFPKTFGLTEMKKGFFPYLFNLKFLFY